MLVHLLKVTLVSYLVISTVIIKLLLTNHLYIVLLVPDYDQQFPFKKISDRKDFHHFLPEYSLFKCIYIYRLSKSILSPVLKAYNPSEQLLSSLHCSLCNYWFLSNDTYYLHILKNTYCSTKVPSYINVGVFKKS